MDSISGQLHDLLIANTLRRHQGNRHLARVLTVYVGIGALIAIAGLMFLLVDMIVTSDRALEGSIIVFGLVLMLSSMTARTLPGLRPNNRSRAVSDLTTITFLGAWRKFEAVAAMALEHNRAEYSPHSIVSIFSSLAEAGLVDPEGLEELRILLKLRNSLVHEGPVPVPQVAFDNLASITQRLRTLSPS